MAALPFVYNRHDCPCDGRHNHRRLHGCRGSDGDTKEPPYIESPYQNHKRIVDYCEANGYYCLDYWSQDVYNYGDDSYKPTEDGNDNAQHLEWVNDSANVLGEDWFQCRNWSTGTVTLPAHANQHLTGNRRAYAAWWIFARLAGWNGSPACQAPVQQLLLFSD